LDYETDIHGGGLSLATIGVLAWQQLWLPLVALAAVVVLAVAIRLLFRRGRGATDV
jgi:ABC-type bacteriocin/lantibiotic exporter with double-glycine peptidase domain